MLCCPFRHPSDLLDETSSARPHFARWNPCAQPKLQCSLEFYKQNYFSPDKAKAYIAQQTADSKLSTCVYADVLNIRDDQQRGAAERGECLIVIDLDVYICATNAADMTGEAAYLQSTTDMCVLQMFLRNNIHSTELLIDETSNVPVSRTSVSTGELAALENPVGTDSRKENAASL